MRWLLIKDLQILKRSPLLVALLVVYPIAIALMIGFALSSPPGKPKVALLDEVPTGHTRVSLGNQQINISKYASQLFQSIDAIKVSSRAEAIDKVRSGQAAAALIIPADIISQINSLITQGVGNPTVDLVLNTKDPLERQFAEQAISSRVSQVEQAVSKQVLGVAVSDLQQTLNGGTLTFLGQKVPLLGLKNSRTIVQGTIGSLPKDSPLIPALRQVVNFANLAIDGLGFATPVLSSIGNPLTVNTTELAGKTTPTDAYAAAIAVIVSLMFVGLLLAAALLALERSENAYSRLVRGLISPSGLLSEKITLAGFAAAAVTLLMSAFVSLFVHLEWSRFPLWVVTLVLGGLAFGALGVAIGGVAREVSVASLMAFLVSLPIAFVALVPGDAVSGTLKSILDAISFVFPFKAGAASRRQRVQRHRARDRMAAGPPRGADDRVRRVGAPGDAPVRLRFARAGVTESGPTSGARLALADHPAEDHRADHRNDDRDHRQRIADGADDRQHQRDDADRAGNAAGHDQLVRAPFTLTARGVVATLLDVGHGASVARRCPRVLAICQILTTSSSTTTSKTSSTGASRIARGT